MPYAYLLMRTDMPSLGLGKSRAQAMHAGNQMTHDLAVQPLLKGEQLPDDVIAWHQEGRGFGTAIAIGAGSEVNRKTLEDVVAAAEALDIHAGMVVDTTYPYLVDREIFPLIDEKVHTQEPMPIADGWRCFRSEPTCAWIFGEREQLEVLLARFSLTPA